MPNQLQELGQWKVGQLVLVSSGGINSYEGISPITKITDGREGTIIVGEMLFDVNGKERTTDQWYGKTIRPATEEDRIRIRGKNARNRIYKVKWLELDPAKAIEIEKILNDNGIVTKVSN